jgi:hypothetical protein
MNRIFLLTAGLCLLFAAGLCLPFTCQAQSDKTGKSNSGSPNDTIRVGNLLIIRNGPKDSDWDNPTVRFHSGHKGRYYHSNPPNISTNWGIVDLGFTNYVDNTNYASAAAQQFAPGATKDWFGLNTGKSVDFNIWVFMQRINLIKHVVNLKYGVGIELNNYRYQENIRYKINPTEVIMDTLNYEKDKLATDYVTVPVMLNFNFTPHRRHDFGFSAGASFGYRYSSRQKFKSESEGKQKTFNGFDLNPWKISYIGELQLGWFNLYGSYATRSIFSKGLDLTPYTFGVRIGNW